MTVTGQLRDRVREIQVGQAGTWSGVPGETSGLGLGPLSSFFAAQPAVPSCPHCQAQVPMVSSMFITSLCPGHPHQCPSWQLYWS